MSNGEFILVRLRGERFKDGKMPLSILADLYSLQYMLIDIAGWRFKNKNPDRKRLPRNFDQIHLQLAGLASGSSVAKIEIDTTRQVLSGVPNQEYFEMAAEDIAGVIGSAETDVIRDFSMPNEFLTHFEWIGYNLLDGEVLEIQTAKRNAPVRLTPQSRERLIRHSGTTRITRDLTLRGTVYEADQNKMTFHLQQIYGPKIHCHIPERYLDTIKEAFDGYRDGAKIRVRGTGIFDMQNKLLRVEPVVHVEHLDPLDVDARLDEFRSVQDGWLEDGGVAPDREGLNWLSGAFAAHYPDDLPLPYTYLMADGGVSLEWSLGTKEVTVEVEIKSHKGEWYVYDKNDKRIEGEKVLDLAKSTQWSWMADQLRRSIRND